MKKIELNKQIKKDALLDSAYNLFTTAGFHKTSISEIALHAGVAKGTFYLYFRDKESIRNELISKKSAELLSHAINTVDNNSDNNDLVFADKMIAVIDDIIASVTKDHNVLRFISKNLSWGLFKSVLASPSEETEFDFLSLYNGMIEKTGIKLRDSEVMLFLIIELVSSTCYNSILYEQPVSIDELKPHLYSTIRLIIYDHCE